MSNRDAIVAAYADGQDMAEIERRYGVTRAQIERVIAEELGTPARPRGPGLTSLGNRVLLGVAVGWVVSVFARLLGAETVLEVAVGVVTAGVVMGLAHHAGTDPRR